MFLADVIAYDIVVTVVVLADVVANILTYYIHLWQMLLPRIVINPFFSQLADVIAFLVVDVNHI